VNLIERAKGVWPGATAALAGAAVLGWLMRRPVYYGAICGHAPGQLHCPACYVAAATIMMGVGAMLLGWAPKPLQP